LWCGGKPQGGKKTASQPLQQAKKPFRPDHAAQNDAGARLTTAHGTAFVVRPHLERTNRMVGYGGRSGHFDGEVRLTPCRSKMMAINGTINMSPPMLQQTGQKPVQPKQGERYNQTGLKKIMGVL
jgi:hypothetical protein